MRPACLLALPLLACTHAPADPPPPAPSTPPAEASAARTESRPAPLAGRWWRDDVFYEIFVRSFADSDGDGVGDFRGLTAKLDVLNDGDPETDTDLGVTGIWLMPIHPSPSYHGYDVTDYRGVNPDYGTMEDFERFLAEAHRRGIRVIIDFVLNHSAKAHPWFQDALGGPEAEHRDWYTFRDQPDPRWKRPWDGASVWHDSGKGDYYYGIFWSGMPDVNVANPDAAEAMLSAMEFWLDKGVDGFRVDAIRHLFESEDGVLVDRPETHAFMKAARARLAAKHPEALLVAEAWTDSETVSQYYGTGGDEFQLAFAFDAGGAIVTAAKDGDKAALAQYHQTASQVYEDRGFEAPFVTNHDMPRAMRQLGGDPKAARLAAATLFALPGTPFVYYGEEIGMQGGAERKDEDKRTPMRWTAAAGHGFTSARPWHDADEAPAVVVDAQRADPKSLWSLYRDLISLRRASPPLADGRAEAPELEGGGRGGFALLRTDYDGARVLFVANYHREATGPVTVKVTGTPTVLAAEGLGEVTTTDGALHISSLGPQSFAFLRLE